MIDVAFIILVVEFENPGGRGVLFEDLCHLEYSGEFLESDIFLTFTELCFDDFPVIEFACIHGSCQYSGLFNDPLILLVQVFESSL